MRFKLLTLYTFLLSCILYFGVFSQLVLASSNFSTDYSVIYTIAENDTTSADINISLTNKTPEFYASSYKIQIGFETITNVKASDPDGTINPVLEKTDDGYIITLNFNKRVTGLGKKLDFKLTFDTPDIARKFGNIREINIPGIANPEEFNTFNVEIKAPSTFGKPIFTKPYKPLEKLVFTKQELDKSGISISFGDRQYYTFHLTYHIKNDNLYPVKTEIAIPPTTNYQTVYIQDISPLPENVIIDEDDNWLAQYKLGPSQKMDVVVRGKVEISLDPVEMELKPEDRAKYLEEKQYWQVTSDDIQRLARELKTPEAIYKFVVNELKYDFSRVTEDKPRLGGLNALKKPDSAVCLEYTDLFITLARAAGIPAREVNGYAYTQNPRQRPLSLVKDILHAWPQYYDDEKKTWIMIDPTWGSTTGGIDYFSTLDFDHFTFVIKGVDSGYPIPAGGYKFESDEYTKDVSVDFAYNIPNNKPEFELISLFPGYAMSGLPISGALKIKNTSQTILPPQELSISSGNLSPGLQILRSSPIPPFGSAVIDVSFAKEPFLTNSIKDFTASADSKSISHSVDISPLMIKKWWLIGVGIIITAFFLVGLIIFLRRSIERFSRRSL